MNEWIVTSSIRIFHPPVLAFLGQVAMVLGWERQLSHLYSGSIWRHACPTGRRGPRSFVPCIFTCRVSDSVGTYSSLCGAKSPYKDTSRTLVLLAKQLGRLRRVQGRVLSIAVQERRRDSCASPDFYCHTQPSLGHTLRNGQNASTEAAMGPRHAPQDGAAWLWKWLKRG